MPFKNTETRFGFIAQLLHWAMAIIMIGMLILGIYMVNLPISPAKLKWYGIHKEWGVVVFMLMIVRLSWRLINITPPLPQTMAWWEKLAAFSMHYAFYFFMAALPITGWMLSSAAGFPVSFFGLFLLPDLVQPSEPLRLLLTEIHKWLGYALIAAIIGHAGAALQHHFFKKDDILRRMLP
jgi:cytochrome b561